ncbi:uncharacterized protein LOC126895614 [Daktulosphaira vitifoliae]|uniref:uncharacterized protein LOC126895614 n=1 Tax=Daktulosphaira vitifoliae TaxID=58002 RepID=UPI0021AABE5E|nr:uncharacterized protein LOC126895614 [Daktulosphaira vitifoliae]XP_050523662.1 uncharacterized protein LOC126895614 [Daktulosphaira vitifoliae]XP_050523663.1 uncharacterized protein LOC126895614 [Daktulosphaira vitifoliae]XP_050523664.1 uncharacterized protein LOC126895614 [Daktulosphaira vitifoliae]XP_050523665.1 uncharacterized protein LOC126895614 [Daktulosphaira vitifoliae]
MCNIWGFTSSPNGYYSEIIEVGSARCQEIHKKIIFELPMWSIIQGLKINHTTRASHTIAGSLDSKGNCDGITYITSKGTWHKALVQAKYEITLTDGDTIANYHDNYITLSSGTKFKLSDLYGFDSFKGEVIWSTTDYTCDDEYATLYDGPASLFISKSFLGNTENIKTFVAQTEGIAFALKYIKDTLICNAPMIQIEHPMLFILMNENHINSIKLRAPSPHNTDLIAYVNTKFVWLAHHMATTLSELYTDITLKKCLQERNLLLYKLSLASYSLTEFSYSICNNPGCMEIISGEIIYLIKCKPVQVQIAKKESCYHELPVIYQNNTYFMLPKTKIKIWYSNNM